MGGVPAVSLYTCILPACMSPTSTESGLGILIVIQNEGVITVGLVHMHDYLNMTWRPSAMERKTVTIPTAGLVVLADPMQLGLSTVTKQTTFTHIIYSNFEYVVSTWYKMFVYQTADHLGHRAF